MHTIHAPSARSGGFSFDVFGMLLTWIERREQRHALALLDDRLLKDVGLSRASVDDEISKPFWMP
jgi:uncharacterized protein YjiS (DUF1127 family)